MSTTLIKQREPRKNDEMMGLQEAGFVLFPETETVLEIPFVNGKYHLGLTPEETKSFEAHFGVTFDSEAGQEFLEDYRIVLNHDINAYSKGNMDSQFQLKVLKANKGMGVVRFNEEDDPHETAPFIATTEEFEVETRVNKKAIRNQALAALQNLMDKSQPKLIRLARYLFDVNHNMDAQTAYDRSDEYITENIGNAENFLRAIKLDPEYIDAVITVKMAIARGIIRLAQDKWYVNHLDQTKLGRNVEEIVTFLTNPQNFDQMGVGNDNDSAFAIKRQLKETLS